MLARFDASVMLPVSAAAMKYASCLKVNFIGVDDSWVTRHPEAGRALRIECAAHIVIDLRRVYIPNRGQRGERLRAPVDAQIDNRPADVAHDQQARGMNRPGLATPLGTCTQSL